MGIVLLIGYWSAIFIWDFRTSIIASVYGYTFFNIIQKWYSNEVHVFISIIFQMNKTKKEYNQIPIV